MEERVLRSCSLLYITQSCLVFTLPICLFTFCLKMAGGEEARCVDSVWCDVEEQDKGL